MKTRNEYLKELSIKFEDLDSNDLKKMKELLLMINMNEISGNITDPNQVISIIDYLRGDEELFNWTSLLEECKKYVKENPYKKDYKLDDLWQYMKNMIQATKINAFLMEFPRNRVSLIAETKFDLPKTYIFLSYCLYTDYNLCCRCTINPIGKILHNILINNPTLPYYYPVYEMTSNSESLWDLEDVEKNVLPFFGTKEKFNEAFKELNGVTYTKFIIELKKERGYDLTPEEIAEYGPVDAGSASKLEVSPNLEKENKKEQLKVDDLKISYGSLSDLELIHKLEIEIGQTLNKVEYDSVNYSDPRGYALDSEQRVIGLILSSFNLTQIPLSILFFKHLRGLQLYANKLEELPSEIGLLENLEILSINFNKLKNLPSELGQLNKLVKLSVLGNQIKMLPKEILSLPNLQQLSLNDNPIEEPPLRIAECGIKKMREYYGLPISIDTQTKPDSNEDLFYQYDMRTIEILKTTAVCSDKECPCLETKIPEGSGYLYISQDAVVWMKTLKEGRDCGALGIGLMPVLVCEKGAKLRGIDLKIAAGDAKQWWETGKVPLRPTPMAKILEEKGDSIHYPSTSFEFQQLVCEYAEKQEFEKAIDCCNEWIRLYPNDSGAYLLRGSIYVRIGQSIRGLTDMEMAKALKSG